MTIFEIRVAEILLFYSNYHLNIQYNSFAHLSKILDTNIKNSENLFKCCKYGCVKCKNSHEVMQKEFLYHFMYLIFAAFQFTLDTINSVKYLLLYQIFFGQI